jgi:hypothetical protein
MYVRKSSPSPPLALKLQKDDYQVFRRDNRLIVKAVMERLQSPETSNSEKDTLLCLRGLEKSCRIKSKRSQVVESVLDVQKELQSREMSDPKGVYVLSKTMSKMDRELAILWGSLDEIEAIRVWEGGTTCSSESQESDYFQLSKALLENSNNPAAPPIIEKRRRGSFSSPRSRLRKHPRAPSSPSTKVRFLKKDLQ